MSATRLLPLLLLGAIAAAPAAAKTWEVKMVDAGAGHLAVYEPAFLKIKTGDTVKFIATGKGHNAEAIASMIPTGADVFKGGTDEEISITPKVAGIYAYKCRPHYSMGMVGVIEVGDASNLAAVTATADKLPPLAKKTMTPLLAMAK